MGDDNIRYRWDSGMSRGRAWAYTLSAYVVVLGLAILIFAWSDNERDRRPSCPTEQQRQVTQVLPLGTHGEVPTTRTACDG